jgi:hypothetical protein
MTDVKLTENDAAVDSAGRMIRISDADAEFQRAYITASVKKGSFIYDRTLGCDYVNDPDDEFNDRRVGLCINEAMARFGNASAKVIGIDSNITLQITIDGESRTKEVRLIGNV